MADFLGHGLEEMARSLSESIDRLGGIAPYLFGGFCSMPIRVEYIGARKLEDLQTKVNDALGDRIGAKLEPLKSYAGIFVQTIAFINAPTPRPAAPAVGVVDSREILHAETREVLGQRYTLADGNTVDAFFEPLPEGMPIEFGEILPGPINPGGAATFPLRIGIWKDDDDVSIGDRYKNPPGAKYPAMDCYISRDRMIGILEPTTSGALDCCAECKYQVVHFLDSDGSDEYVSTDPPVIIELGRGAGFPLGFGVPPAAFGGFSVDLPAPPAAAEPGPDAGEVK